jgi:hypothetical protein
MINLIPIECLSRMESSKLQEIGQMQCAIGDDTTRCLIQMKYG